MLTRKASNYRGQVFYRTKILYKKEPREVSLKKLVKRKQKWSTKEITIAFKESTMRLLSLISIILCQKITIQEKILPQRQNC